ncbi:hypothetical protein AXX17_AT5G04310 [Arabidopsis thaliana]|uniref:Uncharacterized protein n=1 Tax=Arabidopsis thaliana TaxID=3702 RepID=A0A178UPN6_ARATH|nr:hypothetical protein AXX17_AT5G04310 [Arabidopsis thaliana]
MRFCVVFIGTWGWLTFFHKTSYRTCFNVPWTRVSRRENRIPRLLSHAKPAILRLPPPLRLSLWPPLRTLNCSIRFYCIFLISLREVSESLLCVSTAVKSSPFSSPILLLSTLSPSSDHDDGNRSRLIEVRDLSACDC